ncbi:hypothetical protein [Bradyrhizobium sp. LHD-71]|uniref:hypothetical protein n=1 Tax=Bradyrhizobium sp. LHD-71 TaxID=3072141 RepID=UPI00281013E5|nr:hypothetical protein [Bradyrhizobium sp. LHD-71]MDQ8730516.1 hypothetical protein [Bradyrhizobium sp. LHD-71]
MSDHDEKVRKLRRRSSEQTSTMSELLVTRLLEDVIEELQAEVDKTKEEKRSPAARHRRPPST